jgi:hypothetical protein
LFLWQSCGYSVRCFLLRVVLFVVHKIFVSLQLGREYRQCESLKMARNPGYSAITKEGYQGGREPARVAWEITLLIPSSQRVCILRISLSVYSSWQAVQNSSHQPNVHSAAEFSVLQQIHFSSACLPRTGSTPKRFINNWLIAATNVMGF